MSVPSGASRDPESNATISSTTVSDRSKDASAHLSRWVSGFDRTVVGTTFTLEQPGVAVVNGRRIALDTSDHNETLTDNATNYVWLEETMNVAVNTTGVAPSTGALLLWEVTLTSGSVTAETDHRDSVVDFDDRKVHATGFDAGGAEVENIADGTSATSAVSKSQAETIAQDLGASKPVRVATTADITLANLQTVDGVSLAAADRVLVKDQSTGSENGIYSVVDGGSWTRATDFDSSDNVLGGKVVEVSEGTTNEHTTWKLTTDDPITVGSTSLTFALHSVQGQRGTASGLATLTSGVHTPGERPSASTTVKGDALVGTANPAELHDDTPSTGASTTRWAREDHVHAHGDRGGGSLHADATPSTSGFHSAADKTTFDATTSAATPDTHMKRDGSGRSKVADPSVDADIDNKGARDSAIATHAADVDAHHAKYTDAEALSAAEAGATTAATADKLTKRTSNGVVLSKAHVVAKSSGYTVASGDWGHVHHETGTHTVTLPSPIAGFQMTFLNAGTGVITFSHANLKSKATTLAEQWGGATLWSDGTNWYMVGDLS